MSQQTQDTGRHCIDGEWTAGAGEETFESTNPATGRQLGEFHRGTPGDVERAVSAAEAAFEEWRAMSYIDRAEVLWDVYHELRDRTDELGAVVTKECGKEISEGRADVVAIASRDTDFKPAIEAANACGLRTLAIAPGEHGRSDALRNAAADSVTLDDA